MPQLTINGKVCDFEQGQSILEVALANEEAIPHYCWHESLSVVANCRICLGEVWAPNPRNEGKLEAWPKLVPTCQTRAVRAWWCTPIRPKPSATRSLSWNTC